jgi:hypothetical protein
VAQLFSLGGYTFMKNTFTILVSGLLLCGCCSMTNGSSAERLFLSEHPNATILSMTRNDEVAPNDPTRSFVDIGFVYRNPDATEHEEVLHYKHSTHGWYLAKKEQLR